VYTSNHPADSGEGKKLSGYGGNSRLVADTEYWYAVVVVCQDGVSDVGAP
jgi:hypothetical protein